MGKLLKCKRCGRQFFNYDKGNHKRKYCGKCQSQPKAFPLIGQH